MILNIRVNIDQRAAGLEVMTDQNVADAGATDGATAMLACPTA
ncbi:MAG: hypothetical protein PHW54_05040 [Candidatus Omnitrophica bacterium]|nr:hypothetical protein [Candidatus Omnitrophota bacterium]